MSIKYKVFNIMRYRNGLGFYKSDNNFEMWTKCNGNKNQLAL